MGRGVHCTESEKKFILKLNSDGLSIRKIVQIMKCSITKVFNAIHSKKSHETRGRKRKTSGRFDQRLVRLSKNNPFMSSSSLNMNCVLQ